MRTRLAHCTILVAALLCRGAEGGTLYVTPTGAGDCLLGWENACSLATALNAAQSGDEIWVKAGMYSPFTLKNGVKVIGGFAGSETLASQSDPNGNPTIVDGGNASQCIWSTDNATSTVLRGFKITNCIDTGDDGGGGLIAMNSSAQIVHCEFYANVAARFGGAVAIRGTGSPQFVNCIFRDNGTGSGTNTLPYGGGAVYVYAGNPIFTNCLFYNNKAIDAGAVFVLGGAPSFINCTVVDNHATVGEGGGLLDGNGVATATNCIFWDNSAGPQRTAHQIYNGVGLTSLVTRSDVAGGFVGTNNINADPLFVDAANRDYSIQDSSPCKDNGWFFALPADTGDLDWDGDLTEKTPLDLARAQRVKGTRVDFGAYENQSVTGGGGGGKGQF